MSQVVRFIWSLTEDGLALRCKLGTRAEIESLLTWRSRVLRTGSIRVVIVHSSRPLSRVSQAMTGSKVALEPT